MRTAHVGEKLGQRRRSPQLVGIDDLGCLIPERVPAGVSFRVVSRVAADGFYIACLIPVQDQMAPVGEGTKFQRLQLEDLETIAPYLEFIDNFRGHGVAKEGAGRKPIARDQLFRSGRTANQVAALHYGHPKSDPSQISRCDQAIVASSDYDDVEVRSTHLSGNLLCLK